MPPPSAAAPSRRACAGLVLAALASALLPTASAASERPVLRLELVDETPAGTCPDQPFLERQMRLSAGYPVVRSGAPRLLRVTVKPDDQGLSAELRMISASGKDGGGRTLRTDGTNCRELLASVALTATIILDAERELEALPSAPPPRPRPLPRTAPPDGGTARRPARPSPPPAPRSWKVDLAAGLLATTGSGSLPAPGAELAVGFRWPDASLAFEGRADWPMPLKVPEGSASTWLAAGGVASCVHFGRFGACGTFAGGARMTRTAGVREARSVRTAWVALGARGTAEWSVGRPFYLSAAVDLRAPLHRTTLRLSDRVFFRTAPVTAAVLARFGARL